jgi:superfamily I DNA and/or RNA helicase
LQEEKDLNTSTIGLDDLKMIAVEIKDIEKFFESLEDIENNYLEINDVFNPFDVFKEINFESNEMDFPELEDIQIIKELTLSESLEKSSSISSLLNNKIISLGEEPKEKIYTLNCQSLEQIIDDLKDFKESVSELEEELEKSFLFKGENLEFTLSKETINNILKLFGNLKTEEFPENLSRNLAEESINKAFLLLNKYLNIKNDQKIFYETLEDENLSGFIKSNYEDRKLDKISNLNIEEILEILDLLRITSSNLGLLLDYFRDKNSLQDLGINKGIEEIISISLESGISASLLFDSALLNKISEKASLEIKLSRYKGETLNQLKKQFCQLDKEFIENTSIYLNNNLYKPNDECLVEEPSQGRSPKLFTEGKLIRHEEKKSKRHLPLRLLFKQAYKSIINLHPCVMMSPSTAAQYLPKKTDIFDVLIIDEASQMKPEQAFSLIARCKQMIIVGDQKQLPPSSRFEKDYTSDEILEDDVDVEYSESILELADKVIGSKNALSLGWHYRSRHTSLIDFSNYYFYDNKLTVFASNDVGSQVVHKPVENSQYRGGVNLPEVKAVMDALLEQIKSDKEKSIIIATMNQQQESEVTLALEAELQNNKMLRDFDSKHQGNLDELVVKKLEDIQGDERDVVIISTVYGPDADGKITQMFGDINRANGHRRLNVLFTRAKHKVILVTSLRSSNIKESKREGPQILKKYLEYAEKGEITDLDRRTSGTTENAFEESIRQALTNRGYVVDAQVGSGGYSIDLAIRDPNDKSRYILAVECDGKAYHSSYSARANDRLRQEVLEGKGWNFFRIWSTDWNRDPISELDQLDKLVKKLSNK